MTTPQLTKFTNGYLLKDGQLVPGNVWISSESGRIVSPQSAFYGSRMTPDRIIDLQGKILSPGFLDVQLNGGYAFDFSVPTEDYASRLRETNRKLIQGGVTSYLPTVTSQKPEVYHAVLPHLGPSKSRNAADGSESLGAHVEGPFLSPAKNGIHTPSVLQEAKSWKDIEDCYGTDNLANVSKITAAPELGNMTSLIPQFVSRNIIYSIGHTDATFEQAQAALSSGARMVTHMFNAMRPFGHRDPGVFGLLGQSQPSTPIPSPRGSRSASPACHARRVSSASAKSISSMSSNQSSNSISSSSRSTPRSSLSISVTPSDLEKPRPLSHPYFGLISDGIHLSPQTVKIAYAAHPSGVILVTDAMALAGLPDGTYSWTNDEKIIKSGPVLRLEKNGRIAGSAVTLIECLNNFRRFTGADVGECLRCVTETPAKMLGGDVERRKGGLDVGKDADLVVLGESEQGELAIEGVWKFGVQVI